MYLTEIIATGSKLSTIPKELGYCALTRLFIADTLVMNLPWTMNRLQTIDVSRITTLDCIPSYLLTDTLNCIGCDDKSICIEPSDKYANAIAVGQCNACELN